MKKGSCLLAFHCIFHKIIWKSSAQSLKVLYFECKSILWCWGHNNNMTWISARSPVQMSVFYWSFPIFVVSESMPVVSVAVVSVASVMSVAPRSRWLRCECRTIEETTTVAEATKGTSPQDCPILTLPCTTLVLQSGWVTLLVKRKWIKREIQAHVWYCLKNVSFPDSLGNIQSEDPIRDLVSECQAR